MPGPNLALALSGPNALLGRVDVPSSGIFYNLVMALNPIFYLRLGEPAGSAVAFDECGRHNGTYGQSPVLGQTGSLVGDSNTAMRILNTTHGYVRMPKHTELDLANGAWTFHSRVKRTFGPGFPGSYTLLSKRNQFGIVTNASDQITVDNDSVQIGHSSKSIINNGLWRPVVVSHAAAATTVKVYIDGADVSVNDTAGSFSTSASDDLVIGGRWDTFGTQWEDYIDECFLVGSELDASRIADLAWQSDGVGPIAATVPYDDPTDVIPEA